MLQTFDNVGYLESQLSDQELIPIRAEIESIKENFDLAVSMNKGLAGNLQKEFEMFNCRDTIYDLVFPLILRFNDYFKYSETQNIVNSVSYRLKLDKVWVNFQGPCEFNPVHRHTGLYSFVIWVKIPYRIKDEIDRFPNHDSKVIRAGTFNFYYINSLGKLSEKTFYCDRELENTILVFPSELHHCVYPFYTSDEYRISVSGNLCLDI